MWPSSTAWLKIPLIRLRMLLSDPAFSGLVRLVPSGFVVRALVRRRLTFRRVIRSRGLAAYAGAR